MIRNLETRRIKNTEQDWLKTNLAKFSRMLQGQTDLTNVGALILSELARSWPRSTPNSTCWTQAREVAAIQVCLRRTRTEGRRIGKRLGLGKAWSANARSRNRRSCSTNVPSDYIRISSGLGEAPPRNLLVLPLIFEGQVKGVSSNWRRLRASTLRTRRSSIS